VGETNIKCAINIQFPTYLGSSESRNQCESTQSHGKLAHVGIREKRTWVLPSYSSCTTGWSGYWILKSKSLRRYTRTFKDEIGYGTDNGYNPCIQSMELDGRFESGKSLFLSTRRLKAEISARITCNL